MGNELQLGCLSCKIHLWLGSKKPEKWQGFQLHHPTVKRFLTWHSKPDCELFMSDDYTNNVPWDDHPKEWKEDITSRSYWDSITDKGFVCAECNHLLTNAEDYLSLTPYLAFCNTTCHDTYIRYNEEERQCFIYDSRKDIPVTSKTEWAVTAIGSGVYWEMEKAENEWLHLACFFNSYFSTCTFKVYTYSTEETKLQPWHSADTMQHWQAYDPEAD